MRANRVSERAKYGRSDPHSNRASLKHRGHKAQSCWTFLDSKKAFDTVRTAAVIEAPGNQGVSTQFIGMFRELYNNFTSIPPYEGIIFELN
ncbi:unnamed protein product [Haemonchus placei]|uniref:Reverse transcriptase domain-containing protein n=1 Tax=Haemonchus placei TaxID=6290 RepID=A0A0N4W7X9_HAEPC|nr:unnamed protein product [Haemonchus placei]